MRRIPVALFRSEEAREPDQAATIEVSFDVDAKQFYCDCTGYAIEGEECPHVRLVLARRDNGGRITLIPNSDTTSFEEMKALVVEDGDMLREYLLARLPIEEMT